MFVILLKKDCFDQVVFKWEFSYFQRGCQKAVAKNIYFATSWNFAFIVSELEKYVSKKYKKFIKNHFCYIV